MPGVAADAALERRLAAAVESRHGRLVPPAPVVLVADLPKTRNMKVMRRVVRAVWRRRAQPGDLSALVNPESVAELRERLAG